jgi:ubiquinone/menaquinone biosynthesis C-methylase UbiE
MGSDHLDAVRTQFTRQAEVYARMRQTTDQKSLDGLAALTGASAGERVLDVACGPGFLTMTLAARAEHATGCDATDAFLDLARAEAARRGLANVEFRQGRAEALPFAGATFDVVTCRAAFHHFPEPARVLAEMRRVAKPGARLLVADMLGSEDPAKAAYHDRMERLCDPSHARAVPESELRRLLADAGLEVTFAGKRAMDLDVEEWIAHGGPSEDVARELRDLVAASLDEDLCGLAVRREAGRLVFSHQTAAFLLARPA